MKWIPFSETYPHKNKAIIVTDLNRGVMILTNSDSFKYKDEFFVLISEHVGLIEVSPSEITHWAYISDLLLPNCSVCKEKV